jgi:hypothetical protein
VERVLTPRRTVTCTLIAPAATGWQVSHRQSPAQLRPAASLDAAGRQISVNESVHLALPGTAVVVERMELPATDRAELLGMMRLQLEKTLPFPADEVTADLQVIRQDEKTTTLLAIAVSNAQLRDICEPLRALGRMPERITLFAAHIAAELPPDQIACAIYKELGQLVIAVSENGNLGYTETLGELGAEDIGPELAQALLSAEMAGAPASFHAVYVDPTCADVQPEIENFFGLTAETLPLETPFPDLEFNLLPITWQLERRRAERQIRTRQRVIIAGAIYLALLLSALGYIFFLRFRVGRLDRMIAAAEPQIEFVRSRQQRWQGLAPAIDPSQYSVELLYQILQSMPSEEIRITTFDQTPTQFMVEGEAPSAPLAVEFGENLKKNPALSIYSFEIGPPVILPNEHAQFRIFARR